ncbi:MAG: hypothetical protein AB2L12_07290 [Smithellaceae bacterium]
MAAQHIWKFFRAGGFDQVQLDSGDALMALDELDQKLWVALACPTTGLEFDSRTLAFIDTDKDGRIRAPELIAAVKWAGNCLNNSDDLLKSNSALPLNAINDATSEGRQLLASANQILTNLGKKNTSVITLEDLDDTAKIIDQTLFNGDGIITADCSEDEAIRTIINDIIDCLGPEIDRSGKPGVNQVKVDQFFDEAYAYSDWMKQAENNSNILPLGVSTPKAAVTFQAIQSKIDDYFTRCRLAAFDPNATSALNPNEKDYLIFVGNDIDPTSKGIANFPLAQVGIDKPLPLGEGLNPAWANIMADFEIKIIKPLFNEQVSLKESQWMTIKAKFASYTGWTATKAGGNVVNLSIERVREILSNKSRETITALIERDKALEFEYSAIIEVERLIRYYRDLYKLVNNFVSFRDFYSRKDKAIFQAGTLYLDQRSCDLCLIVQDVFKHAAMAGQSGTYLAYCDCVRKGSGEQMQIVAAFTDGNSDNLMVGRNGIFYDRKGQDWDATISKLVENPISIRQAFWAPYRKLARMIQEQIAKRAANADQAANARLAQRVEQMERSAMKGPSPAPEPPKKIDTGMIAAMGVGAAGLGGMVGGLLSGFLNLKGLMPVGILAIILIISGPSMVMAWLKLRKRNLGPILDANGWAVNAKAKINVPFGASLTQLAVLPPGAKRDLVDPFAEKKRPWGFYLILLAIIVLALGWTLGKFDGILSSLSPKITSSWIIHSKLPIETNAAAQKSETPAEQKK